MLIHDEKQIKKFIDTIYPPLIDDEVLFVSLSSRAKYLSEEQKEKGLRINRNEMFNRRFFNGDKDTLCNKLIEYIDSIHCEEDILTGDDYLSDYYTSNGFNIPLNTVTVYININPSSMKKAAAKLTSEVVSKLIENDNEWFIKLQSKLNTEVQKAKSRRELIDIDFDVDSYESVEYFLTKIKGTPIKTHSGYHVLINKKDLEDINLGEVISYIQQKYDNKEIIINSNAMIPIPGTFQGNKKVSFV